MAASPINIATNRTGSGSNSPHAQQSSQLQQPRIEIRHPQSVEGTNDDDVARTRGRQESVGMLGTTPYGARSIPARDVTNGSRRESNALSGSLMNGMSWGGISVGSFIRDDIMMAGTSPYQFQSPSFHSSSYLPKMEANYMKDYVCCDIRLASMHELLQHYEEAHAAQPNQTMGRTPQDQQYPTSRVANAASTAHAVQQQTQAQQSHLSTPSLSLLNRGIPNASPLFSGQSSDQIGSFDSLDDMDMEDNSSAHHHHVMHGSHFQPQPQFGRQLPRGPSVNVNVANAFQGQSLQTPTTPRAGQQGMTFQNNPTVSSVNTPTLGTRSAIQQTATPEASMPSTPATTNLELDYSHLSDFGNIDYTGLLHGNYDLNSLNLHSSGTIDDPAKRLLSKQGYGSKGLSNPSLANNGELAKRLRETQLLNGLAGAGGFVGEEIKPFKCPVIGCEKAYKNQNGLKYHKQHGHQNQQLKENPDGTFSIVDPTTSIPYPGTIGMEKEKPYRCEVCGKRYKNLNGLKYHRQHSPPCNSEFKLGPGNGGPGLPHNVQCLSANVAGAAMSMNETMSY